MPALDFSDLLTEEPTAPAAPPASGALDFSDLVEEPKSGVIGFDDLIAPQTPVPPLEGPPPSEITPPPTAAKLGLPAGLDPEITGGAQIRGVPTMMEKLKSGDAFGFLGDGMEKLGRQMSGLLGPTEKQRIEESVQWGTDENGNPKFEYKPLADRRDREGIMAPYLKVDPMKREVDDSVAKAAGKAIFNTAAGLEGALLSPGTVITGAVGSAAPAVGRAIGGAFSLDMVKAAKESVQRALHATNPQEKIEGWLSAISSLGFAYAGGAHAGGVDASLRPLAGGKNVNAKGEPILPRVGNEDIDPTKLHVAGAPETAAAVDEAIKASDASLAAAPEAPGPAEELGPPTPNPDQLYRQSIEPAPPIEVVNPETGKVETPEQLPPVKITPIDELQKAEPETQSILDPNTYPPKQLPIADLKLSKEVPNFKAGADPETGVVEGERLEGKYEHLGSGNLIVWERADGSREVVSGRHRFDLARRTGEPVVAQQVVKESDGWTPQRVARLDAEINIRDGQGQTSDYANYFRNSEGAAEDAKTSGILSRAKARAGHKIGSNASDDLYHLYQAEEISEPHTLAIVDAAGKDAGAQKVGIRFSRSNPRASSQDIANRVRAATLVDTSKEVLDQGELWDSGDRTMQAMDKAAKAAGKFQAEARDDVKTLQAALGKTDQLKLTKAEAERFGIHDPNSVLAIRKRLEQAKIDADAWDNWHLKPELRDQVLERSGTAKELVKEESAPADDKKQEETASPRRVGQIALKDGEEGPVVAKGEIGTEHKALITPDLLAEMKDLPEHIFLDEKGEPMSRTEAWDVALAADQIKPEAVRDRTRRSQKSGKPPELHSQDLKPPEVKEPAPPEPSFFDQMGIEDPNPAPAPKPTERLKAADVVETPLDPSIVEVPPGAERVYKAKVGGTTGTVVEYPDRLEVKDLTSLQQGAGGGTAVLESLKGKGKPIELTAGKRSTDTPAAQLGQFYRNRGFTETEPGRFRWEPENKAPEIPEKGQEIPDNPPVTPENGQGLPNASEATPEGAEVVRLPNEKYPDTGVPLLEIRVRQKDGQFQHFTSAYVHDVGIGNPWSQGFPTREAAVADAVADIRRFLPEARKRKGMSAADLKRLDKIEKGLPDVPEEPPLPQAAGASNINELISKQATFAGDVYAGMESANGRPPTREEWEPQFLRNYPHLEADPLAIDRAFTLAKEAAERFKENGGRKPMPAIIEELMGAVRASGVTGIKNAQTDQVRRQMRLPAAMAAMRRSQPSVWDDAMRYMDDNPQAQNELIERLKADPQSSVNDREVAMLMQRQIDLETQHGEAVDAVNRAKVEGNEMDRGVAVTRARRTQDELITLLDINKRVGSEQGRSLAMRKAMGRRDYTLERMIAEERAAKGGDDLSDTERTKVEKDHAEIERTDLEFEQRVEQADLETAEKAADTEIENLKEQAKTEDPEYEPLVASIAERIYARLKKSADEAHVRLRHRLANLSTTPLDLGIVKDVAIIAAEAVARGVRKFSDWRKEMLAEWGNKIDPYLQKAWDEGDKIIERSVAAASPRKKSAKVSSAVRKLDPEKARERAVESIKTRAEGEFDASDPKQLLKLRPQVSKIALSFVRGGITERGALVDAVHGLVSEVVPDITRRQTMDLISGYGDFSELDMEAAKVRLRDIQGELQQFSKIEDLQTGEPLKMTGKERRTKGDEERRLEQQVNELKRQKGVVVTDPRRQLKSSLDAIKTRLSNQIKDLGFEFESGKAKPGKTKVEYDEEALRLKETKDRLQKTLDDITEKPGVTDEQRLKAAMRAAEESLREYERRVNEKDLSREKPSKAPTSAQLDALKALRDAKKAEFEELRALDEHFQEEVEFDRLMKAGDDVAKMLASGKIDPEAPGAKLPDTDLVAAARERLAGLRDDLKAARAASPAARQAKIKAAADALQKSIDDYEARIKSGAIDPVTRKPAVDTPELQKLRQQRDALRKVVDQLRAAKKPKLSKDEIGLKAYKTRITNENADLKARMAAGNFAKKPVVKLDISKDKVAIALKAENTRIKREFEKRKLIHEKKTRTELRKNLDRALQIALLPRALKSSFDVSAVLRQGGFLTFGDPKLAVKAMREMFQAIGSEKAFGENQARIENHPYYEEAKAADLFLADTGDVRLSDREEAFLSELADKIPGVRLSNRAYISFLNRLRIDKYAQLRDNLVQGGILRRKGTAAPKELKAIANFVNIATGRGALYKAGQAAHTLSAIFFSPRLLASRFELLAGQPLWQGSARTRLLIAREYGKTMAGLAAVLSLGALVGGQVETDPRSSDFLKVRFGNTSVDFLFGMSQVTALVARTLTGTTMTGQGKIVPIRNTEEHPLKFGQGDTAATTGRFIRSKLAPIPSAYFNATSGKNVNGDPTDFLKEALGLFPPLSFGDVASVMEDQDVPHGVVISLLALLGASVQSYERKRKKAAAKYLPEKSTYLTPRPDQL